MHDININKIAELSFRSQETVHSKGKLTLHYTHVKEDRIN